MATNPTPFKLNLSGISFTLIDVPEVEAVFMDHLINLESKASGQPTVRCDFTVTTPEQFKGRKLFRNFSFQPDALPFFKRFLVTMGVPPETLEEDFDVDEILTTLHGDPVVLVVGTQEYQGQQTNTVKAIKSASAF